MTSKCKHPILLTNSNSFDMDLWEFCLKHFVSVMDVGVVIISYSKKISNLVVFFVFVPVVPPRGGDFERLSP